MSSELKKKWYINIKDIKQISLKVGFDKKKKWFLKRNIFNLVKKDWLINWK